MSKDKLTDYSATNASNTDVGGVNINEGMLPSDVNNAIREVMTHLKDFAEGTEAVNSLAVDNININGNTISSTDTNGDITIDPNGSGQINLSANVDVTGTVTADGLDVQGDGTISGGSRLTISDIADVNNDGIRLDDNTTSRFNNLTQDTSGNFKIQHWTGSAWQNNLTITTDGSVGIGSAAPDALLQIEKSDSGTTINKEPSSQSGPNIAIHNSNQTANNLSSIQFTNRGTNGVAETATAGIHVKHEAQGGTYSYGSMNFNTTNSAGAYATRMHISAGGSVGIGTVPKTFNTVDGALQIGTRQTLTSFSNDVGIGYNHYYSSGWKYTNSDVARRFSSTSTAPFIWQYAASGSADAAITWSEAMRLDASGNLLVGGTSLGENGAVTMAGDGRIYAIRASDTAGFFGRTGADGSIVNFTKDGTGVGSIGVRNGHPSFGNSDTGIELNDFSEAVQPFNTSTNSTRDAAIDLGSSSARFKDLYLSGGVYLGGNGSTNHLDDYEEGTWTPTASGGYTVSSSSGAYTKIGRVVHLWGTVQFSGVGGNTSTVVLGSAPFTNSTHLGTGVCRENTNTGAIYVFRIAPNSTSMEINTMTGVASGTRTIRTGENYAFHGSYYVA